MVESEGAFRRNPAEVELETELGRYESARAHAESALSELLEGTELSPEDERTFLTEQAALLHADVSAIINDHEGADAAALGLKLQRFARQLYVRKHPDTVGLKKKKHEMRGEADAARELLVELRTARRTRIEVLRGEIGRLGEGADLDRAVDECCALMEEEIGSLRANGDEHAASTVSASLEVVRGMKSGEDTEDPKAALEHARHVAHTVVAALVIRGRVQKGNVGFAERLATKLILAVPDLETDEGALERAVVTEVSGRSRGSVPGERHIDEKRAFVDSK